MASAPVSRQAEWKYKNRGNRRECNRGPNRREPWRLLAALAITQGRNKPSFRRGRGKEQKALCSHFSALDGLSDSRQVSGPYTFPQPKKYRKSCHENQGFLTVCTHIKNLLVVSKFSKTMMVTLPPTQIITSSRCWYISLPVPLLLAWQHEHLCMPDWAQAFTLCGWIFGWLCLVW